MVSAHGQALCMTVAITLVAGAVHGLLRGCGAVHGRHEGLLDTKGVVQHLHTDTGLRLGSHLPGNFRRTTCILAAWG